MFAVISPEQIHLPPGAVVRLEGTWQDYQALVDRLGDRTLPRIKYRPGEIILMSPMARHGREAHVIATVASILFDHYGQDYEAFTPITMDLPEVRGIEPDYCFYVDHLQSIVGKDRINWAIDPPPDLVIEIDVTSYTNMADYLPYRVPEVWLWKRAQLQIHQLINGRYVVVNKSQFFPAINLAQIVTSAIEESKQVTTSRLMRTLRQKFPIADH
jgi:Uma2 family endonuclease